MLFCKKRQLKLCALSCLGAEVLTALIQAANPPALEFDSIPAFGSQSKLLGRAVNVNPSDFRVAVYIYNGGWYNKPSFNSPLLTIATNGNWNCDITTGANDAMATRIAAFLMASTNSPPLLNGTNPLPAQLEQLSVAELFVNRYPTELSFSGYKWEVKDSAGGRARRELFFQRHEQCLGRCFGSLAPSHHQANCGWDQPVVLPGSDFSAQFGLWHLSSLAGLAGR